MGKLFSIIHKTINKSGDDGIRTHVPRRANAFRVRPVMTTSIHLQKTINAQIIKDGCYQVNNRDKIKNMENIKYGKNFTLRNKLAAIVLVVAIPFLLLFFYLLLSMRNYSKAYDTIVSNITMANNYNLNFKEEIDESIYRMVARDLKLNDIKEDPDIQNPYDIIAQLRHACDELMAITEDNESRIWLQKTIRNTNTLQDRVDDICANLEEGNKYDINIEMLDNNIYILTELIQDDIQNYIFYQAKNIEILKTRLNEQVDNFNYICLVVVLLIASGTVFFAVKIAGNILKNIHLLCAVTEQISEGDFSVRAEVDTNDEIEILAASINDMSKHLEEMVDTIKEDERRMRHTELRLLQEQINPHFLYNTLDTIVWLIESNKSDQAEDMVMSLSTFFRLVLSHGQEFITIADEERHIRSYLEIQQVRYKDILDYEINIDSKIYPYEILKLTLQPLVENALYHGIKYKRAKGKIVVTGSIENEIITLCVEDDGVGMDEDVLNKLQSEIQKPCQETDAGFGLANVNERIRMNFGQEYGMKITSKKDEGTKVIIEIPARIVEKK